MMSHVTEHDLEFLVVVGAGEPDPLHALIDRHRFYPLRCETERPTIYASPDQKESPPLAPRVPLVTASCSLFGGSLAARQIEGGVDQGDVRERLREVPELAPQAGIIFLGQEADIVLKGQE